MLQTYASGPVVAHVSLVSHPVERCSGICVSLEGVEHYYRAADLAAEYGPDIYRGALVEATARTGHARLADSAQRDMFGYVMWARKS